MTFHIRRATTTDCDTVLALLQEYYSEIGVMVRDDPGDIERYISGPASGIWLAWREEPGGCAMAMGCILLRPMPEIAQAGEVKRLYVRAACRGQGVAKALRQSLEAHAAAQGTHWLYLDTKDDLQAAIAFYEGSGYQRCERYNANPQATIFMRKQLPSPPLIS